MAQLRVNHIHLRAPNPEESANWYVEKFGLKIQGHAKGLGGTTTVRLDSSGRAVHETCSFNSEKDSFIYEIQISSIFSR